VDPGTIEKLAIGGISGIVAFLGAGLRFYLRIQKLETEIKEYKKAEVVKRLELLERLELTKWLENTKAALQLEVQSHKHDLEDMIREIRQSIRSVEDSSHDYAKEAALAQFMQQQQDRWEKVQRTLGQIEGLMKRMPR
jgi:hypothetical protein